MTWFKVDDKFHSHIKTARAGVDTLGLWVMCGSWCADHLTDGFVPDYIALRMDSKARSKASKLVSAGLWSVAERGGDRGWQFHDWCDMQPTKDDVETRREQEREKKRRYREKASRGENGQFVSDVPDVSTGESTGDKEVRPPGSPVGCPPVPVPSRPVPSRPDPYLFAESDELAPLAEQTTQGLIAEWLDHTPQRPPGRVIGQVSKELKVMLDEGQPYEDVRAGLAAWAQKGLHPSTLASVVHETRTPKAPRASGRRDDRQELFEFWEQHYSDPNATNPFMIEGTAL